MKDYDLSMYTKDYDFEKLHTSYKHVITYSDILPTLRDNVEIRLRKTRRSAPKDDISFFTFPTQYPEEYLDRLESYVYQFGKHYDIEELCQIMSGEVLKIEISDDCSKLIVVIKPEL